MKFKVEISLLMLSIVLFLVSSFCYYYERDLLALNISYPYRLYAFPLIGLGSVLLLAAGVLYSKRK